MDEAGVANRAAQLPPEVIAPGFRPEFAAVKFGIARVGAVAVPINFLNRRDELGYVLEQSDAVLLITMDRFRNLDYLLKVNQKIASSAEHHYTTYLKKIFEDMINVYRLYTVFIQQQHKMDKTVKQMRQARRDILKLI